MIQWIVTNHFGWLKCRKLYKNPDGWDYYMRQINPTEYHIEPIEDEL